MKTRGNKESGFTLLELIVVITVIVILAALLLPVLTSARASAHSTTCKSRLRQLGLALQMYVDDHESRFPYYRSVPDPAFDNAVGPANTGFWWTKLLPYYPIKWTDTAYHCPGYKGAIKGSIINKIGWTHPGGSYAYNALGARVTWGTNSVIKNNELLGLGGRASLKPSAGLVSGVTSEGQIVAPSEMFAIGESRWKDQGDNPDPGGRDFMQCGLLGVNRGVAAFDPMRHGKKYNQLFCDGHISAMSPWVIFNPTNSAAMWNYDHQPHPETWPPF